MFLTGINMDQIIGLSFDYLRGEQITFFIACLIVSVLAIIIGISAKKYSANSTLNKFKKRVLKLSAQIEKESVKYNSDLEKSNSKLRDFLSKFDVVKDLSLEEILQSNQFEHIKKDKEFIKLLKERNNILNHSKLKKLAYKLSELEYDIKEWPFPKPRGFYNLIEMFTEYIEKNVLEIMDFRFIHFTGYVLGLTMFMLTCFILGIAGFPNPFSSWSSTLTIALVTFIMIHVTAIRYNKWHYFYRYIEPVPFFLPINLLSMWSPLITLSLRLFGNALAGWCLSTLIYYAFYSLGVWFISPVITPVLHAYFDVFSGCIQTIVFTMLTMIFVSQEAPAIKDEEKIKMGSMYR